MIIIGVIIAAVYFFFLAGANPRFYGVVDSALVNLTESAECATNFYEISHDPLREKRCSEYAEERMCLDDPYCIWCQGEVNNQRIFTCGVRRCGCPGSFFAEAGIDVNVDRKSYAPGDTVKISGNIYSGTMDERGNLDVKISFLNREKRATSELGPGTTLKTTTSEGNFEWEYEIDGSSKGGDFYVLAEYVKDPDKDVRIKDVEFFSIRPQAK